MSTFTTRFREFLATDGITVLGIFGLTVAMALLTGLLVFTDKHNGRENRQKYDAIVAGITYAKEKCMDDKLSASVCNTVSAEASKLPCSADKCWMIYAHSEKSDYIATMTVQQNGDSKPVITDYRRDAGAH